MRDERVAPAGIRRDILAAGRGARRAPAVPLRVLLPAPLTHAVGVRVREERLGPHGPRTVRADPGVELGHHLADGQRPALLGLALAARDVELAALEFLLAHVGPARLGRAQARERA